MRRTRTKSTRKRRTCAGFALLFLAWSILTFSGATLHHAAWSSDPAGRSSSLTSARLRPVSNALGAAAKPGWVIAVRIGPRHYDAMRSFSWAVVANGLAWGGYLGALGLMYIAWRRWYHPCRRFPFVAARCRTTSQSVDLSRRAALLHGVGGFVALGGSGTVARATMYEPSDLRVRQFQVPIKGLPHSFDGMRIAILGDTHLGPYVPPSQIERAVELALGLRPDLVALVGDYSHHDSREIQPAIDLLAPLCAPNATRFGVVAVLGNHDWYSGASETREALRLAGAHLIENARVFLDASDMRLARHEPQGASLCIAGVGDLDHRDVNPDAALEGVRPETPRVMLSHNPDVAEHPMLVYGGDSPPTWTHRVDLMLSGHTHGGQVRLPLIGAPIVPVRTGNRYADGLNQGPAFPVVTTRGVGMSLLPVRFNCPPEILLVQLRAPTLDE